MYRIFKENKETIFCILAIVLIIFFAISISPKRLQNDTFYTVTIGKLISENGLDGKDHFSWHNNLPYTYPHWLYDLGMYQIYNLGGWNAIYISTCILTSILGICIYFSNERLTKNKFISFIVTIGSLYLLNAYITARAQLATFICFILLIYNIERFLANKKIINAITILLIQTIIVNLHVAVWPFSFVLYLPYITEYIMAELIDVILYKKIRVTYLKNYKKILILKLKDKNIDKRKIIKFENRIKRIDLKLDTLNIKIEKIRNKRNTDKNNANKICIEKNKNVRWLIIVMIIAIFTAFLTPYGDTVKGKVPFVYTYLTMQGNSMKNISEHLPLTLIENVPIICTLIIILAILTFSRAKIRLSDLFLLGGLTFLMFSTKRQQSMLVLIGTIPFSRILISCFENQLNITNKDLSKKSINNFIMLACTIIVIIIGLNLNKKIKNQTYINSKTYPVEASEWILKNLDVNKIRLFNEYNYGSYLLFKGIPVFIDSRCDLYTPEFNTETNNYSDGRDIFSDFIKTSNLSVFYGKTFEKYGITHVILYKNSKINMIITNADSEKYEELYSDDNFVIYEVLK